MQAPAPAAAVAPAPGKTTVEIPSDFRVVIIFLGVGFFIIIRVVGFFLLCEKNFKKKKINEIEIIRLKKEIKT
jgi:hypothetical protein